MLRLFQLLMTGAALTFFAFELRRSVGGGWHHLVPSWPRFLAAILFTLLGLSAAGAAWRALLAPHSRHTRLMHGFYIANLAKYVPGGVWQPIGQIGFAAGAGIDSTRAVAAFSVQAVTLGVSGSMLGAGIAFTSSDLGPEFRLLAFAAFGCVLFLHRRWMIAALNLARRVIRRMPEPTELPEQRSIMIAFAWNAIGMLSMAISFAILIHGGLGSVCAFAAAWTIGYAAIPVPSGIGVREAVLVAVLAAPASVVVGAALAQRVAQMLGELTMAALAVALSCLRSDAVDGLDAGRESDR